MSWSYNMVGCFISCFYIKPQHVGDGFIVNGVVLYLVSTSNHNRTVTIGKLIAVVLYLVSTSNHNCMVFVTFTFKLFYILFLHQTTTSGNQVRKRAKLFYILFLHQTTTPSYFAPRPLSCFISCFYIKPQLHRLHT